MMKLSLSQQLKTELMMHYGLKESQIDIKLEIKDVDLETGKQIAEDFDKYSKTNVKYMPYFTTNPKMEVVLGNREHITQTSIFLKEDEANADS